MKYITTVPVPYSAWLEQAGRFTRGKDSLIVRNLPENTDRSGVAEIHIELQKSLLYGFQGIITYKQNFLRTINSPILDEDGNETGDFDQVDTNGFVNVISYQQIMDYATINAIITQVDPMISDNLVGLDRLTATVEQAILIDIVSNNTFGLTADQFIIVK